FHFTPTSASWLNAVEGFFAKLTNQRLKRGVFRSVAELETAIERFIAETNADPKPFLWTARPNRILAAVQRGHQTEEAIHQSRALDICQCRHQLVDPGYRYIKPIIERASATSWLANSSGEPGAWLATC